MYILAKVVPNSKSSKIEELTLADLPDKFQKFNPTKFIKVWVKSPAKNNKANSELIKLINHYYAGTDKTLDIKIILGSSGRYKLLKLSKLN